MIEKDVKIFDCVISWSFPSSHNIICTNYHHQEIDLIVLLVHRLDLGEGMNRIYHSRTITNEGEECCWRKDVVVHNQRNADAIEGSVWWRARKRVSKERVSLRYVSQCLPLYVVYIFCHTLHWSSFPFLSMPFSLSLSFLTYSLAFIICDSNTLVGCYWRGYNLSQTLCICQDCFAPGFTWQHVHNFKAKHLFPCLNLS